MGTQLPRPQRGTAPPLQFSAHIWCRKMAGWINMPLGREVGLSQSDIVLDGDPTPPPQKGGTAPKFSALVYCGQTAEWIKMPLGAKVGLSPGHMGTQLTPQRGTALNFRTMSIVAKRSPISATAEHLFLII